MTFALHYLRQYLGFILIQALFVCIFAVIFWLYHLPLAAVLYPAFLCLAAGGIFLFGSGYHAYKKHERLLRMQSLPISALQDAFTEDRKADRKDFVPVWEKDYGQIIIRLCRELQLSQDKAAASYRDMIDYFTVWVHQIKTPIASMRLHLDTEDSGLARRAKSELLHIEQYVEMVLTYLKIDSGGEDYVFRKISLDQIIRENIQKFRGDFIMKKLGLLYTAVDETVITDEKWLSFVVGQVLSNALKYTNRGTVTISLEAPKILCISDTGIGIAQEDIPRIFEKGFTGSNGRQNKRASGLGLYLCRQICNRIGALISIESQEEVGTTVRIDLSGQRAVD